MVSCAIRSCARRTEVDRKNTTGITFHRFPKNTDRCQLWVKFVNRDGWTPLQDLVRFARNIFLRSHSIEHQNVMLISNQMLFRQYIQTR
ncbi:unnamed protein product [Acanthoscelides obtectus]|uniref:THAP-type domain-containing protein n=1 Tax=Acanthoscelides obtectus TaxID=200917 RepID=A0A9P0P512_ACAOB|nr:unnamed protein product [Acanthoscelides obtectus]CAK1651932.1 hypothetical protein AOBTE_LOCUS17554 [Acanthoscelides obtectus]